MLIYNLFSIFISSYIKEVGELKLIGARKKDIIKIFLNQFIIIWLISVAIGSLIGGISSVILIRNYIFSTFKEAGFIFEIKDILFPMLVTFLITILSAVIPIIRYSNIPALECLNRSLLERRIFKSIRLKKRSLFTRNILGLFTRNTRYLVVSVLSFSIMGILFFQMTFRISNDFSVIDMQQNNLFINDMVITPNLVDNNLSLSYFDVNDLDKAKKSGNYEMVNYKKEIPYTYLNVEKSNLSEDYYTYNKYKGESVDSKITFKSYSDNMKDAMKEFLSVGSIDGFFDNVTKNNGEELIPAIVSDTYYNVGTMENSKIFSKKLKVGDIFNITVNNIKNGRVEKLSKKILVVGVLNEDWIFKGNSNFGYSMEVIVSSKNMDRLGLKGKFSQIGFVNKKGSEENNKKSLEKIFSGDRYSIFDISSYAKRDKVNESIYLKEKLSQIIMLFILAISNMILMIRASIIKREKEFSIMRSIGMSIKEKYRWIISENMLICLIIIIVNLVISNYIYYSESKTLNELYMGIFSKPLFDFRIPVVEIIIFIVILFLSVIVGITVSRNTINKNV